MRASVRPIERAAPGAGQSDRPTERVVGSLPVHFFSLAFGGLPFLRHHLPVFSQLPFPWHWHVVAGLAESEHANLSKYLSGERTAGELRQLALAKDGATAYLARLAGQHPDRLTIYSSPAGSSWADRQQMLNAPLTGIHEECLLWRVEPEELWSVEQLIRAHELFLAYPDKTAAFYYCHFFVGPKLVVTTRNTYGNAGDREWIRTWRYSPGCQWTADEPPRLCRRAQGKLLDVAAMSPLWQAETEAHNLVFQRFAWTTESQAACQQALGGHAKAVPSWRRLQATRRFPVVLRDYFPWVHDQARVDRVKSLGISPLARKSAFGQWTFLARQPATDPVPPFVARVAPVKEPDRILFVRIDAIGDAVLAASMLPHLRERFPAARLGVVCQETVRELYEACPLVERVIAFDKPRILAEETYRREVLQQIEGFSAQLVLNSTRSRGALDEVLTLSNSAPQKVGLESDLWNISPPDRRKWLPRYTRLIPSPSPLKNELERYVDFLAGLDIKVQGLAPQVWTTDSDEAFARAIFEQHQLEPSSTIALFPGAQHEIRVYPHYARALEGLGNYRFLLLGGPDAVRQCRQLAERLRGTVNLTGKTTLRQVASLLRKCRLYVGAESAGVHIACAVGTPNVVVLGGGHFGRFLPYSPLTSVVCLPLECFGCNWACRYERVHCVKDLAPEVLREAIRRTLSERAAKPRVFAQSHEQWTPSPAQPAWQSCERLLPGEMAEII
jgi:ADP-heptose:LPS heptosyltransferase